MQNKQTDLVIIGAGPAGIFTALELLRKGSRRSMIIVEKGCRLKNGTAQRHRPDGA